ncbi:undecaprenyl-phosphate glucose phosphotransferase [Massilia sp. S19_KUP03_FR1]|uniref:undecaprenyl-phosphate glucose phosphotransferase n=1 Tax=Massilia sp. S19_KUP03_FR1 TaxID=3025503 RepID=UPI002FCD0AEA
MTVNDLPLIAFFQRVLDPLTIMGSLYGCCHLYGEPFNGYALVLMILAFFVSSAIYQHIDPYRAWRSGRMPAYCRAIVGGWGLSCGVLLLLGHASGLGDLYDERVILAWFVATPLLLLASHLAVRAWRGLKRSPQARGAQLRSVVVVGVNEVGVRFAGVCERQGDLLLQMRGYFDDRIDMRHGASALHPVLGRMAELAAYVREQHIKMIFISQPLSAQPRIRRLIDELEDTTASVYFLPDVYIFDLMQARFDNVGGMPVIAIRETPFVGVNSAVKRISDVVLALLILVLVAPLMLAVAICVWATSPGPVIFRQRRYGLYGDEIVVYKFRSMTVVEDGGVVTQARARDARLTPIGAFLRRTSLDELPQFWNVLQGRMSIVGPRPHAVAHNEQYRKLIKGYMLRHKVKPGITGWAQVNGLRGETSTLDKMQARVRYDLDYLRSWSLWLDLWIIVKTIKVVITQQNAH